MFTFLTHLSTETNENPVVSTEQLVLFAMRRFFCVLVAIIFAIFLRKVYRTGNKSIGCCVPITPNETANMADQVQLASYILRLQVVGVKQE